VTPWTITQGTLAISSDTNLGDASGGIIFNGGTLQTTAGITSARTVTLNAPGGTIDTGANTDTFSGPISGPGGLSKIGAGTLILSGTSSYSGATNINAGTVQAGAANAFSPNSAFNVGAGTTLDLNSLSQTIGSLSGSGPVTLGASTLMALTTGNDNTSTTYSGVISGSGGLTKIGTGNFVLSGANSYTGPTNVNGGILWVNGSITASTLIVNAGGTLGGTGTVGPTIINGGTLAPGNSIGTITIQGSLVLGTAATYLVQISPSQSDLSIVTGTAFLAGTVLAAFSPGSYVARSYTILTALGGRNGTFGALTTSGLPSGFAASLGYTGSDAIVNLTAVLGQQTVPTATLSQNQRNVANSLNTFFNTGGTLTPAFVPVFGLTGVNLANGLSQLSGEAATGAPRAAFEMTNQFLAMMLDPFVDGRSGSYWAGAAGGIANGFANDAAINFAEDDTAAALPFDTINKAPAPATTFDRRWSAWGGGFGGTGTTNGDTAGIGSHDVSARDYGFAGGMDYRPNPDTALGFALAGGGTNWSLAQGLGSGRSDAFQAGLYASGHAGSAYLATAVSFANHWMSTDRYSLSADHLTARFNAQNYSARAEAGYRVGTPMIGITPYAAGQAQSLQTPNYTETDVTGGGFGLAYTAQTASDLRSELGARFDALTVIGAGSAIVWRARAAWAHDWVSDPSLLATFTALPGANFTVTGATAAANSALASAGAELRVTPQLSVTAKFDSQIARSAQTYAGTGTVRYVW
jgi:autotransporter-associated beta strand protein